MLNMYPMNTELHAETPAPKRVVIRNADDARAYLETRGLLSDLTIDEQGRVVEHNPCTRCGGHGHGSWFQDGGICYDCRGANTLDRYTKISLVSYARTARKAEMAIARKRKAAKARADRKLDGQRAWCERNGHGAITFAELDERREQNRKAEAAETFHLGTVGECITLTLEFVHAAHWDGTYGTTSLYIFRDVATGQAVTWKTGRGLLVPQTVIWDEGAENEWIHDYERAPIRGDVYHVKATVKEHGEYKGTAQTKVLRLKVDAVAAQGFDARPTNWEENEAAA